MSGMAATLSTVSLPSSGTEHISYRPAAHVTLNSLLPPRPASILTDCHNLHYIRPIQLPGSTATSRGPFKFLSTDGKVKNWTSVFPLWATHEREFRGKSATQFFFFFFFFFSPCWECGKPEVRRKERGRLQFIERPKKKKLECFMARPTWNPPSAATGTEEEKQQQKSRRTFWDYITWLHTAKWREVSWLHRYMMDDAVVSVKKVVKEKPSLRTSPRAHTHTFGCYI